MQCMRYSGKLNYRQANCCFLLSYSVFPLALRILGVSPSLNFGELPYSGKLSREKTFAFFAVSEPSMKVFSAKFAISNVHIACMRVHCACARATPT